LLTLWNELELKVFLPKKGDGFIVTSQAKAGEVLDVYAVEFSKTAPRAGYPRKKASAHGGPRKEVILERIRLQSKGSPVFSRVDRFRAQPFPAADA
jgi:hypothetical protein